METIRRAIALAHKEQRALVGALPLLWFFFCLLVLGETALGASGTGSEEDCC